jgi:hypothetical protein
MRFARLGLASGVLASLLLAQVASATAPPMTTISIDVVFGVSEHFTTTGGVVCDSGDAVTDPDFAAGWGAKGRGIGTFHLVKTLTCDDGSGTFQIRVDAAMAPSSSGTLGGFAVIGGTGDYGGLRGAGSLAGTYTDYGIVDLYSGRLVNVG